MTWIVERRAFYECFYAMKSQYYRWCAAEFNVLADNFVVCRDVVLESRTWTRVLLESCFLGLGLETCAPGLATYGLGLGLGTSGLELGVFYLNENTLISKVFFNFRLISQT